MRPTYYVIDAITGSQIPATIRLATQDDFLKTEDEQWQTS